MGFLNKDSLPHLVEKLSDGANIKISGNSYGNRVSTVVNKIVTKADEVTRALEQEVVNNAHSFKVGTGNVDVSSDVQDGFGEVSIKGVTYHNLFNDFSIADDIKDYVSINGDRIKWNKSEATSYNVSIKYDNSLAKPNKTYTLVFYIYKNTLKRDGVESPHNVAKFNIVSYDQGTYRLQANATGLVKAKLNQPESYPSDGKPYFEVYKDVVGELEISHPILLEGDYTNDDNIPNETERIVGVGDKCKNLFNYKACTNGFTLGEETGVPTSKDARFISDFIEVKELTSIFVKVMGSFEVKNLWSYDSNKNPLEKISSNGFQESKFTIPKGAKYIRFPVGETSDKVISEEMIKNIKILVTNYDINYEPYYSGYKIEVLSHGKNLAHYNDAIFAPTSATWRDVLSGEVFYSGSKYWNSSKAWIYLPKGHYRFTYKSLINCSIQVVDRTEKTLALNGYFDGGEVAVRIRNTDATLPFGYEGIQIERVTESGSSSTLYTPYSSDKTQILLDEPLMRLPNSICDEITRDGKLIRRVGKKLIDTNVTDLRHNGTSSNHNQFVIYNEVVTPNSQNHANLLCDKKPCKVENSGNNSVWIYNKATLVFQMDSTINSVEKMRQWLSQNPTTVYYELEAPVVTELPSPYLRMFKDGHLRFNTLVAPESTHVVQLNKSGQIERSVREVQSLDSRVKKLESFYDDMILETSHKLNLLSYDFEYIKESEDI